MPGTSWFWLGKSQGIIGTSYLCSNQDGKNLITHARKWWQEAQYWQGLISAFLPLLLHLLSMGLAKSSASGSPDHSSLSSSRILKGMWGFRSLWKREGWKTATTFQPPSRSWRPWGASSSFFIARGALRMENIYPVSKKSRSYRKIWGGFLSSDGSSL